MTTSYEIELPESRRLGDKSAIAVVRNPVGQETTWDVPPVGSFYACFADGTVLRVRRLPSDDARCWEVAHVVKGRGLLKFVHFGMYRLVGADIRWVVLSDRFFESGV